MVLSAGLISEIKKASNVNNFLNFAFPKMFTISKFQKRPKWDCFKQVMVHPFYPTARRIGAKLMGPRGGLQVDKEAVTEVTLSVDLPYSVTQSTGTTRLIYWLKMLYSDWKEVGL